VQLREADIYVLIDRTGSMGGEIDQPAQRVWRPDDH
jgi:uncharacterized protein with von Willebrand factor type A (vWA) domain